jgi:hypothetical protein
MSFSIYSQNLVDQSTLTASTQNSLFPVSNVKDYRRSKVFRSTSNSDNIVFDFGETSDVNTVFLVSDKRSGFGFSTVTLEFNATNVWTSPAATESVAFSVEHGVGFAEFTNTHSYRFCRMVITSTLGYCEVSNLFLGVKNNIVKSINFNWNYKDVEIMTQKSNRYGQLFTDVIARQKTINCSLSNMNKDNLDEFFKAYDYCGESKPLFIRLGCAEMSNDFRRYSGMVFFQDVPAISNPYFNKYSASLVFKEAM